MGKRWQITILVAGLLCFVTACTTQPEKVVETVIVQVTATAKPAVEPTPSEVPTNIPTDVPTETPLPEPSPTIFSGVTFSGGETFAEIIKLPDGLTASIADILYVPVGSAPGQKDGHFSVQTVNEEGLPIDTLVIANDIYMGEHLLGLDKDYPYGLKVDADNKWQIAVSPLTHAYSALLPSTLSGSGGDFVYMLGYEPESARIIGNQTGLTEWFSVSAYNPDREILVNTTEPFDDVVEIDNSTFLITVNASGPWSIEIFGK